MTVTRRIALQEDMLPGPRLADRFAQAAGLGVQGIEFWSQTLSAQVDDIQRLNGRGGVAAASVNHGRRSRFLDPDPAEIVADLFHMALDEPDIPAAIRAHGAAIGHVHLADSNRRLPGQGTTDFKAAFAALDEAGYAGWMAFECGEPGDNRKRAAEYLRELPASLRYLLD